MRGPASVRVVLAAFSISGAAALVYEVAWTRALSLVLGSTTYAVSTMLATFMAGLALGGFLGGRLADRTSRPLLGFALCELGIGLTGLVSLPLIHAVPSYYLTLYRSFHQYPGVFFTLQIVLCALVMLLPTTLMGATFPLVSRAITQRLEELGSRVGSAYGFNTLGAVAGSLGAGFLLIPMFGLRGAVLTAGALNLLVGAGMALRYRSTSRAVLAGALALYVPAAAWAYTARHEPTLFSFYSAHRHLDDGPFATIAARYRQAYEPLLEQDYAEGRVRAIRARDGRLLLQVGGKTEGSAAWDLANTLLLAYLPLATHPEPRSMLVVGLGAGVTLGAARGNVDELELVEIHPGVIDSVSRFGRPGTLEGVRVVRNDARHHLLTTEREYDVISSAPSYPTEATVGNLFTRESFELAAERLEPGGVLAQSLPYYLLTNDDVTMMIKTFATVFPHAMLWRVPDGLDLILLGSRTPFLSGPEEIRARVAALNDSERPLDYVLSRTPEEIAEIARREEVPINTDDHPILEFRGVRNLLAGNPGMLERGTGGRGDTGAGRGAATSAE